MLVVRRGKQGCLHAAGCREENATGQRNNASTSNKQNKAVQQAVRATYTQHLQAGRRHCTLPHLVTAAKQAGRGTQAGLQEIGDGGMWQGEA
jgi:hypothetical protein